MATIHKLTKDGATIFPATITDAVVHPQTGKTLTSMMKDYNVSELFPTEGIDGGNKYNLALAIQVLGTHLSAAQKTGGIKLTFISSVSPYPEEEYYLGKSSWSTTASDWDQRFEVGDVVADPSGSWTPGTAEQYIDSQIATVTGNLASETVARQTGDSNLQTQLNAEVTTRYNADQQHSTEIDQLRVLYENLTQSDIVVGPRPSSGQLPNVIYREPDQGHTPPQNYSDYMWYNNGWVLMATYDNAIDNEPTAGSENLVKSGGVDKVLYNNRSQNISLIANQYVERNGVITPYSGWSRTNYLLVANMPYLLYNASDGSNYCAWYDINKDFISAFGFLGGQNKRVYVPKNAVWCIFSASDAAMNSLIFLNLQDIKGVLPQYKFVDDVPIFNSGNLVKSGGIANILQNVVSLDIPSYFIAAGLTTSFSCDLKAGKSYKITLKADGVLLSGKVDFFKNGSSTFYAQGIANGESFWITPENDISTIDCYIWSSDIVSEGIAYINILMSDCMEDKLGKQSLPEYSTNEKERVYKELLSRIQNDVVLCAFNTDQHISTVPNLIDLSYYHPKYVLNGIIALKEIAKKIPMDAIVFGGDFAGYDNYSMTLDGIFNEINLLNSEMSDINQLFVPIPGNHDAFDNNNTVTAQALYNLMGKRNIGNTNFIHTGTGNCNAYVDDDIHKLRYIFIDDSSKLNRDSGTAVRNFLLGVLPSIPEDYKAIIFSHHCLTSEFDTTVLTQSGENAFGDPTLGLQADINPYTDKIIACISGHSHVDADAISSSGILYIAVTCAASHSRFSQFGNIPNSCTLGTFTDTAFDIFVVNQEEQTLEALRYGQGSNRKWKYKGTGQGLIAYTNCISGVCSIGSATLTFINSTYNTDAVTVQCDTNGGYEVYLKLGQIYNITSTGYTPSVSSVYVDTNKVVNITLS